jgi:L-aminopeptidase/D-esterase-like protein
MPSFPQPSRTLGIPGFRLGHGSDTVGLTGVTVILCPAGVTAAAEVRGSATGTRQFDSLVSGHHVASRAHAVVLAGASGFGLAAADPVVDFLARHGHGFQTGIAPVPLVPTAILFDLGLGDPAARPTPALVRSAIATATNGAIPVGSVGAGTGATVGKALGLKSGMKGGFGFARLSVPGGPTVAAAVAVNAFGDVRRLDGTLLAGCRTGPGSRELASAEAVLAHLPADAANPWEGNTTLAVVMTEALLTKAAALKVCQMAFGGFYRTLSPALSLYGGRGRRARHGRAPRPRQPGGGAGRTSRRRGDPDGRGRGGRLRGDPGRARPRLIRSSSWLLKPARTGTETAAAARRPPSPA